MAKAPAKMNRKELLVIILVVLFMVTSFSAVRSVKMSKLLPLLVMERSAGTIGWQIPQKMKQGVDEKATVRIAGILAEDLSKQYFQQLGKAKNIEVFPKMTVHLKSGGAFKIKSLTEDDQIVLKDKVTEWRYLITPVKAGLQEIDIEVGIRMRLGPGETETSFNPTQTEQIEVEVDRGWAAEHFWEVHWESILKVVAGVGGVITIVIAILKYLSDKKKKRKESGEEPSESHEIPELLESPESESKMAVDKASDDAEESKGSE